MKNSESSYNSYNQKYQAANPNPQQPNKNQPKNAPTQGGHPDRNPGSNQNRQQNPQQRNQQNQWGRDSINKGRQ